MAWWWQVQGEKVHGLDLVANMKSYEFTFQQSDRVSNVLAWLSHMCQKANLDRERERIRPFETPYMESLLERCAKVHEVQWSSRHVCPRPAEESAGCAFACVAGSV